MATTRNLLFLLLLLSSTLAAASPTTPASAIPGRLVIKYRPTVNACAHCLLKHGTPFARVTGRDSLDRLNQEFGVHGAHGLFMERHGLDAGAAAAAWAGRVATVRSRSARQVNPLGSTPDLSGVYVLDLPTDVDVVAAAARFAADPDVEYAHPDHVSSIAFVPNDPFFGSSGSWGQAYPDLWGLHLVGADVAWDTATGAGTVVAVVDTGVDRAHADLAATTWTNPGEIPGNGIDDDGNGFVDDVYGWDFAAGDADPMDEHGHGTHVAGIVAAAGNDARGVVGMAFGARIMAVRGIDASGSGHNSDLAAGMVYAAMNGADVINDSWGGQGLDPVLLDAVNTTRGLGVVVVAAAGNSAIDVNTFQPARFPGGIAVAASDPNDQTASFSNFGNAVSVAAPGVDVLSTWLPSWDIPGVVGGSWVRASGTSMASPHVAGLAALILAAFPGLVPDEVRWHLELNADQPGYPGFEGQPWNPHFGWGRINAAHAFDPVPVTARVSPSTLELHAFAGALISDVAALDLGFTTIAPVSWTTSGPSWLVPSPAGGSGPTPVSVGFDGTGVAPGTSQTGTLAINAPSAVDGGVNIPVTGHAHRDSRFGNERALHVDPLDGAFPSFGPVMASNGGTTVAVWARRNADAFALYAGAFDGSGAFTGPTLVADGIPVPEANFGLDIVPPTWFDLAADGQNYLVVWTQYTNTVGGENRLLAVRLGSSGVPLSVVPIVLAEKTTSAHSPAVYYFPSVGFDGSGYVVLWEYRTLRGIFKSHYNLQRLSPNGTFSKPRNLRTRHPRGHRSRTLFLDSPRLACRPGGCFFTWVEFEKLSEGQFEANMYGMPVVNERANRSAATLVLHDVDTFVRSALEAGGGGYLAATRRLIYQSGVGFAYDMVAARVTGAGVALDPNGLRVNRDPAQVGPVRLGPTIAHDGTNWLVAFATDTPSRPLAHVGRNVYLTRFAADGSRLDNEPEGLLVHAGATARTAYVGAAGNNVVVGWTDRRHAPPYAGDAGFASIYAQQLHLP